MALVLGAAFGPRATLVEVRDADSGELVASGTARHDQFGAPDDPTTWWRSLAAAVSHTGQREIDAISVSGGHAGLVLLDGAGAVLPPTQPWSDADAAVDASRLRSTLGADRWARRVGALPGAGTLVSRLAWLRRSDPDTFGRIGAALLPHDWLTYRLAGRLVTDRGSASLTGAWSPTTNGWLTEVLELIEPRGERGWWLPRLPQVLGAADRADWLTAPVYELLGLRGRPLVAPGTGEAMAVALALGVAPQRLAVSIGATTTVLAGTSTPVVDPTGAVRSRADATGRHLAISTAAGGAQVLDELRELFALGASAALDATTAASPPLANDLVVLPGVEGRPGAVLTGLTSGVSAPQLVRAAFDGVACAALDALDLVRAAGVRSDDDEPIRLAAPGADLDAHARILADLSGRVVLPTRSSSLAAAGACVQAAAVLHEEDPAELADAWALWGDAWVEPRDDPTRPARRARHSAELARQRQALAT